MTFWQRRQQADHLRAIPLEKVLPLCGGQQDHGDQHKWHTPEGVLSVTGPKFMNWNCGAGGGGAIDLVIHLQHLDFTAAVDWLAQHFPNVALPLPMAPMPRPPWRIPPPDPSKLERVKQYLVHQRRNELRQKFCYREGGVKRVKRIRCARSDCYRGRNG